MNCTRRTEQSIERARALASIVLPTPGTSSTSRWPSASRTVIAVSTTSGLPSITLDIACRIGLGDLCDEGQSRLVTARVVVLHGLILHESLPCGARRAQSPSPVGAPIFPHFPPPVFVLPGSGAPVHGYGAAPRLRPARAPVRACRRPPLRSTPLHPG